MRENVERYVEERSGFTESTEDFFELLGVFDEKWKSADPLTKNQLLDEQYAVVAEELAERA